MRKAIIVIGVGLVLIIATLVFSSGHHPKRGFLANLQHMIIVLNEGKYIIEQEQDTGGFVRTKKGDIIYLPPKEGLLTSNYPHGHYEGRVAIPTKYPFVISVVILIAGIVMMFVSPGKGWTKVTNQK